MPNIREVSRMPDWLDIDKRFVFDGPSDADYEVTFVAFIDATRGYGIVTKECHPPGVETRRVYCLKDRVYMTCHPLQYATLEGPRVHMYNPLRTLIGAAARIIGIDDAAHYRVAGVKLLERGYELTLEAFGQSRLIPIGRVEFLEYHPPHLG